MNTIALEEAVAAYLSRVFPEGTIIRPSTTSEEVPPWDPYIHVGVLDPQHEVGNLWTVEMGLLAVSPGAVEDSSPADHGALLESLQIAVGDWLSPLLAAQVAGDCGHLVTGTHVVQHIAPGIEEGRWTGGLLLRVGLMVDVMRAAMDPPDAEFTWGDPLARWEDTEATIWDNRGADAPVTMQLAVGEFRLIIPLLGTVDESTEARVEYGLEDWADQPTEFILGPGAVAVVSTAVN